MNILNTRRIGDLVENLVIYLGRVIGKEISTAWLDNSQSSVLEKGPIKIILAHWL